ncbi:MAG TPA: hypothetical protein DCW68_04920 [Rhodospirillaceae bacterium]|nr:MAG: hypothetical protein A2018_02725 [Alphaproteobacteria bacterium GWF2_58_20]HAU29438.1 hypothetical protein [Rhodospirillaceae bacterium]
MQVSPKLSAPVYDGFSDYRNKNPFPEQTNTIIQPSLLPVPYIGNLANAKIFILMGNPGFSAHDMLEREPAPLFEAFRQDVIKNLHQEFTPKDDFPFFYLNPTHSWHNGFIYWESRFREIAKQLQKDGGLTSCRDALSFMAKHIAVLQLVPYHSAKFPNRAAKLPSAQAMQKWADMRLSEDTTPAIIVRHESKWAISRQKKRYHIQKS